MFSRMLALPGDVKAGFDLSSQTTALHAAAPCPQPVKEAMIEWWGPIIHEYYAGSESVGVTYISNDDWLTHKGSVGRPILGEVHIVSEEDGQTELPSGQIGLIYFSGGPRFEYHNDAQKTRAAINERGWGTYGDLGYLDEDGFLYISDRRTDLILSGGVNIYPQEAENVLITHPKVVDVAVFGVPNEDFGEEVKAVVQPLTLPASAAEAEALEQELIAYCRSQLADVKCPRSIDFRAELPRHPTGKLYKRLLKDEYWVGHQSRII
jgi:long-chain acyl-CoA synthetase